MGRYFRRKFLAFFLVLIFILPLLPVGAATQATRDELREVQQRQRAQAQRLNEQRTLLEGTEFEMSSVMAEIQALDQEIMDTAAILEAIETDLLITERVIISAEDDLEIAKIESEQHIELLQERVRFMHEEGTVGIIEVLLQAESIVDFFSRWEYMRMVARFDQELLARLEASQERVAANVEDLNLSQELILQLQGEYFSAKEALDARVEERTVFFAELYADAERYAEFLAVLEEEAHAIHREHGVVMARYRAEEAEAARIRREQEEARRAAEAAARAEEERLERERIEAEIAANPEREAEIRAAARSVHFEWPLPHTRRLSSEFGNRPDPFTGRTAFHSGVDVAAPSGSRINAAAAGTVLIATWSPSWGNYIVIDHGHGYTTLYAHNIRNRVSVGDRVTAGQHIADVGTTGRSTGNHLHFEIRRHGTHLNPMNYF